MACKKLKTGNKTKIYVTDDPFPSGEGAIVWTQVKGATGFTPPDQGRDVVESEALEQDDDIALRSPAGRQGGEITFNVEVMVGEDVDDGLAIIIAALESGDCIGVKAEIGGDAADAMEMLSGIVTNCPMQEVTRTDKIVYAATIACNALYEPAA